MATGERGYLNNFRTVLTESVDSADTAFDIASTTGLATLLGTKDYIALTLDDGISIEIIHVTAVAGSEITVDRAQEGTTAADFEIDTIVECRPTAASFDVSGGGGGGGLWERISTITISSDVTEIKFEDLSGVYEIEIQNLNVDNASDNVALKLQIGTGTPTTYSTVAYSWENARWDSSFDGPSIARSGSTSSIDLLTYVYRDAGDGVNGKIEFGSLSDETKRRSFRFVLWQQHVSGSAQHVKRYEGSGIWNAGNAVTGIRIFVTEGAMKSGSQFHLLKRTY